jgi:hypothetical protein
MKRTPLNFSQRMTVVVGAGVALYFFGTWAMTWGTRGLTGWVACAPLSNTAQLGLGLHPWVRLIIWLILAFVWTGMPLVVLRTPRGGPDRNELPD